MSFLEQTIVEKEQNRLPASDPSEERRMFLWSEHVRPKVGTTGGWDRREYFGHACSHKERYNAISRERSRV